MSQHEGTMDGIDRICPYCGESYQVETEGYSEDIREEVCDECGKKYYSHDSFSVTHHAEPDCELNGEQHKWESVKLSMGEHDFCSVCGQCRPLDWSQ